MPNAVKMSLNCRVSCGSMWRCTTRDVVMQRTAISEVEVDTERRAERIDGRSMDTRAGFAAGDEASGAVVSHFHARRAFETNAAANEIFTSAGCCVAQTRETEATGTGRMPAKRGELHKGP